MIDTASAPTATDDCAAPRGARVETQGPSLVIRRAHADEAAPLAALVRRLFLEAYADCSSPSNVKACIDSTFGEAQQAVELAAPERRTWLVEEHSEWLGYAQLRCHASTPEGVDLARPAQLHRIYLARAAIGRGVGSMLLGTVADAARSAGADGLWLSVWQRAPGPIAIYRRHGFSIVGRATFPVGDAPLIDWIMQRRFEAPAPWARLQRRATGGCART